MYEGIFWYIVRLLLGRRDVTLGLIKCHYAALKLFGLSCFLPYSIGHTRKLVERKLQVPYFSLISVFFSGISNRTVF